LACLELSLVGLLHALHLPQPLLLGHIIQPLSFSCHLILMLPQGCSPLSLKQAQLLPFLQEHISSPIFTHDAATDTCAFKPGCLMSHNRLHTSNCEVLMMTQPFVALLLMHHLAAERLLRLQQAASPIKVQYMQQQLQLNYAVLSVAADQRSAQS